MRKYWVVIIILIAALVGAAAGFTIAHLPKGSNIAPAPDPTPVPTPFSVYEIGNLGGDNVEKGFLEIKDEVADEDTYKTYEFTFDFVPDVSGNEIRKTSGQINIPKEEGTHPVILMARGYVDRDIYETGIGTQPSASYYAENGFITVAPDFLGYGDSSKEAADIYETRFQTYVTFISLIKSLEEGALLPWWDGKNVFIWAHSNGGQVVLTSLAATGKNIPTTLWAPVTKPFPYSVLYYTDESEDGGKYIRKELAKLEEVYDVDHFSFTNYLENINAPMQIHQGAEDDAIPLNWTDSFVAQMRRLDKEIEYFTYPAADHNMRPDWDTVVERDVEYFNSFLDTEEVEQ
jgi:dipeptidyl aminopeptidase/acylaminoacyl peptidase